MKIKKALSAVTLILTVLLVLLAATSCDMIHEHEMAEWENVTEATCKSFGIQRRSCWCGRVEYDTVPALPHTPVTDAAIDATCTAPGKTEGSHCKDCGAVIEKQTETAKLSHSFSEWETVTEATCTSFGLKKKTCECGYAEYDTAPALSHTPVTDAAIDATCTAPGKTEGSHCKDCGAVIEKQTEIAKLSHSFSEWETVTEATCTSFGLKKKTCECGYAEYDTVPALSHTPVTDAAVDATCTAPGKTEGSHCKDCGFIITLQNTVAPTGHSCTEITVVDEAFCNHDGIKRYSCTNTDCSYSYEESYSIPELDGSEIYADAIRYTGLMRTFDRFGNIFDEATAFVISADGKIVTSPSKIDNVFSAVFILGGNEYTVTKVLAADTAKGIAVLQTDATNLPYATLCTKTPVDAERIYMVGAPEGLTDSITSGIISNADLQIGNSGYIQHDATITAGYAGGPLINRYGEVIGVNLGYVHAEYLSVAVKISELASMDYTSPVALEEYGYDTYTPIDQIEHWISLYYTAMRDNTAVYYVQGSNFYYSLGYDLENGYSFVEGCWVQNNNYQIQVRVILNNSDGTYQYYAAMSDGVNQNSTAGFIDAAAYTKETVLTYDSFYGRYWSEADLMSLYSMAVYDTLGFFSYCLDTYFDTLTLETFGFTSVSYDRDEQALTKLNGFLMSFGTLNESTGAYELATNSQNGNDVVDFTLKYTPVSADAPSSTVATIDYYTASGELFRVLLYLDKTENGNLFEFTYAVHDGTEYAVQNTAWGYLDAASLTVSSELTCYEFNGLNDYEDALLADYAVYLSYLMSWLDYVMPNVSPSLSVKDLGFLFYFG